MIRPFTAVHLCYHVISVYLCQLIWWVRHQKIKCTHKIKCWGLTHFIFSLFLSFYFKRGSCPLIHYIYSCVCVCLLCVSSQIYVSSFPNRRPGFPRVHRCTRAVAYFVTLAERGMVRVEWPAMGEVAGRWCGPRVPGQGRENQRTTFNMLNELWKNTIFF